VHVGERIGTAETGKPSARKRQASIPSIAPGGAGADCVRCQAAASDPSRRGKTLPAGVAGRRDLARKASAEAIRRRCGF